MLLQLFGGTCLGSHFFWRGILIWALAGGTDFEFLSCWSEAVLPVYIGLVTKIRSRTGYIVQPGGILRDLYTIRLQKIFEYLMSNVHTTVIDLLTLLVKIKKYQLFDELR